MLIVRAWLRSEVALGDDLHLDALLASHARCYSESFAPSRSTPVESLGKLVLPIARVCALSEHVHACTIQAFAAEAELAETRTVKRTDGADVEWRAGRVVRGSGPGRDRFMRTELVATPVMEWRCLGWRRDVRRALQRVKQVGRLRRHGYGLVDRWDVEQVEGNPTALLSADGIASRHLPAAWSTDQSEADFGAWRTPYWHPGRAGDRIRAGRHVALRREVLSAVAALSTA